MTNMDDELTQEGEQVSSLRRIVIAPGSFTDPNDPRRAAGSVNTPLAAHPAKLAATYGQRSRGGHPVASPLGGAVKKQAAGDPSDRANWTKDQWKSQAEDYGLHVSGNKNALKQRVEEYEANVKAAGELDTDEWKSEIEQAENVDELAGMRQLFEATGVDNADVVGAFDAKQTELEEAGKED